MKDERFSLFVPNTMVRRMNHLTQKDIGYLLYIRDYEGWSNFLLKVPNTMVRRMNHLTQKDVGHLLYIGLELVYSEPL